MENNFCNFGCNINGSKYLSHNVYHCFQTTYNQHKNHKSKEADVGAKFASQ